MLIHTSDGTEWRGAPINGLRHPLNIEQLWSTEELAAIGLQVFVPPEPAPPSLNEVKAQYKSQVDIDAEAQRLLYITSSAGMALTYSEKKEQALAVLDIGSEAANALPNNGASEYPLLAASVGVEAASLYEAAELVMSRYEAWVAIGGAIESKRLTAKKAINDASDVQAVKAAYEAIQW